MRVTPLFTLLRGLPAKDGIHLILLDPRPRVAALVKILLFGAVAHHSGVGNIRLLLGALGFLGAPRRGLICHVKYSMYT